METGKSEVLLPAASSMAPMWEKTWLHGSSERQFETHKSGELELRGWPILSAQAQPSLMQLPFSGSLGQPLAAVGRGQAVLVKQATAKVVFHKKKKTIVRNKGLSAGWCT